MYMGTVLTALEGAGRGIWPLLYWRSRLQHMGKVCSIAILLVLMSILFPIIAISLIVYIIVHSHPNLWQLVIH